MTRFHRSGPLYVPSGVGKLSLSIQGVSPKIPMPSSVPTSTAEIDSYVSEQLDIWHRPDVQAQIKDTQGALQDAVVKEIPYSDQLSLDEEQATAQVVNYIAVNGFPDSPDAAADMAMSYLERQGEQMGFNPAFMSAANLLTDVPQTPEAAEAWLQETAANIGQQYGLPIPADMSAQSLVTASACAVMTTAGIPGVGAVTTTIDALWDGKLSQDEVKGIVTAVGSAVGAAVGQYFGIPAPVGAFVGGLVTGIVYDWLGSAFGFTDSAEDLRGKAWDAMQKAKAAMEAQCLSMATQAWDAYNEFWNNVITNLQQILNENVARMGDGLRYFGDVGLWLLPKDVKLPFGRSLHYFEEVPYPVARKCAPTSGCLYYSDYQTVKGTWFRVPGAQPSRRNQMPNVTNTGNPAAGAWHVSSQGNYLSAYLALAFWGAERYVTPWHAFMEYMGLPGTWIGDGATKCWSGGRMSGSYVSCWHDTPHTDQEYLENLSRVRSALRPEDLEMCKVPEWSDFMFRSLDQVGPAQGLVVRHINQTVAAVAAEEQIQGQMEATMQAQLQTQFQAAARDYASEQAAVRLMTAQVAQARRDLLRERRAKASMEAQLNAGLFMSGVGALAGWAAAEILGRR